MRLFVIDVESTCEKDTRIKNQEIIEFGCVVANVLTLEPICMYDIYVKPVINPTLTHFCTELTGITQEFLNENGLSFRSACKALTHLVLPDDIFASWGYFDCNILKKNCKMFKCKYPFHNHVNLKVLSANMMGWNKGGISVAKALSNLGLEFMGSPHNGLDDALNILRIVKTIQKERSQPIVDKILLAH